MKIENNALNSLSSKKLEETHAPEASQARAETKRVERKRDKAEFSESARLLAKARTAMSELSETENTRLEEIKRSIQSENYTVPVKELANKMMRYFKP